MLYLDGEVWFVLSVTYGEAYAFLCRRGMVYSPCFVCQYCDDDVWFVHLVTYGKCILILCR